jgi:diacylglycerol kinase family enzyme
VIAVLVNPGAGSGGDRDLRKQLEDWFLEAGAEATICLLRPGIDPAEAARDAARSSAVVVAAGGDGTVSAVASALVGTTTPLGVLPLGTLNHFAKDLRIPLDLKGAIATVAAGHVAAVDVGRLNDRTFLNNASIGLYPNIVELRDELRRHGRRKWPAFMSAAAKVLWSYRGVAVKIDSGGTRWGGRTPFVFVGNNEYTVDGLHLGGRPTLTGGRVVAYLTPRVRSRGLPLLLARAIVGRGLRSGKFEIFATPQLDIALSGAPRIRVALDGEVTMMSTPLHFRIDPLALKVLTAHE